MQPQSTATAERSIGNLIQLSGQAAAGLDTPAVTAECCWNLD